MGGMKMAAVMLVIAALALGGLISCTDTGQLQVGPISIPTIVIPPASPPAGAPPANPTVASGADWTSPGVAKTLTLSGTDLNGGDLTFTIVSNPSRGSLGTLDNAGINTASVTYTPPASGTGSDSFTFNARTAGGKVSATGTFTIHLVPPIPAGAPLAVSQVVYTQPGAPKAFALAAMSTNGAALAYTILTPPANGSLTGAAPNMIYVPNSGFTGTDTLAFKVSGTGGDSAPATVTLQVQPAANFTPPVGVPAPSFGIAQTVASVYASDGYYTHWVNASHVAATDSNNPNGSPARPRESIPEEVSAGSVVVIAGGPYNSNLHITATGTAAKPVFYRGLNPSAKPLLKGQIAIEDTARYVILENISLDVDYETSGVVVVGPAHHVAVRHCDIQDASGAVIIYNFANDIVVYNNQIHDCGNLNAAGDVDDNGVTISEAANCWVLDNLVRHCVGSGIVLNPGFGEPNATIDHCYIGRNQIHNVRQSGAWSKQSQDCVFSQNTVWSIRLTNHTTADGIGFQYGPERLWILNNRVFDCEYGIRSGSNSVPNPGQSLHVIGNVIHDIHDKRGEWDPDNSWGNAGIMLAGGVNRNVYNNTVFNCDAGINCPGDGSYTISNNLIANVTKSGGNHVWVQDESGDTAWTISNNVLSQGGAAQVQLKFRNTIYSVLGLQASQSARTIANVTTDPRCVAPNQGDFRLQSGSPAIDAGRVMMFSAQYQSAFGVSASFDANGVARPQDGNGDGTAGWDIGAYELP